MLNNHFYCIIMAGGTGSRFWPISRADKPKQFLNFANGGKSFLRFTYERMRAVIPDDNILVVSLTRYKDLVKQQLPELKDENLLLEPYNRNTAACLTYATYYILKRDPDAVMAATPSDLVINNHKAFNETISSALAYAAGTTALITIGVVPTRADSNFGYIQMAGKPEPGMPVKVKTFTEKPDTELAKVFIETGEFLWNSGIFLWRASVIREQLELYVPEITSLWKGWKAKLGTSDEPAFLQRIYTDMPRISIDHAVMEKTDHAWVYPASFKWADIGNWNALYEYLAHHDEQGNAMNLVDKKLIKECTGSIMYEEKPKKLMALRGLDDYIVIDTDDVLMICPRNDEKLQDFLSVLAMPDFEEYR